jgi:hypothetical protein
MQTIDYLVADVPKICDLCSVVHPKQSPRIGLSRERDAIHPQYDDGRDKGHEAPPLRPAPQAQAVMRSNRTHSQIQARQCLARAERRQSPLPSTAWDFECDVSRSHKLMPFCSVTA